MTDFVLKQGKKENTNNIRRFWNCENYANFIKQKPEIWMFIPCDENGNVLEEPIETIGGVEMYSKRYQQAKERCLFVWKKGFDYTGICEMSKDVEDIMLFEFELTETGIKKSIL